MKQLKYIFLVYPLFLFCQIPPNYYNSAQGLYGQNLRAALHLIIKNHFVVSYPNVWSAFQKTDTRNNGKIWDMYSDNPGGPLPYQYAFGTNECGTYAIESDCYDREHLWPQSWFNGMTEPLSDLFHIYPTDGYVKSMRANHPFGNTLLVNYVTMNGGRLGSCANPGYSLTVFEPINEYKGDIARSYFYMTTRYFSEDLGWGSSDATNGATILPWQLNTLMQWHHQDPVSAKEIARNDSIYTFFQHNRNPFIDHPEWADSIWTYVASVTENTGDLSDAFSVYPNPSNANFYLKCHLSLNDKMNYTVQTITGDVVEQGIAETSEELMIRSEDWPQGIYILNLRNKTGTANLKLIKN